MNRADAIPPVGSRVEQRWGPPSLFINVKGEGGLPVVFFDFPFDPTTDDRQLWSAVSGVSCVFGAGSRRRPRGLLGSAALRVTPLPGRPRSCDGQWIRPRYAPRRDRITRNSYRSAVETAGCRTGRPGNGRGSGSLCRKAPRRKARRWPRKSRAR